MQNQRQSGVIERWHFERRFGFIRPTGSARATVFFHESEVGGEWDVAEGQAVTFVLTSTPKGDRAERVEAA